MCSFRHNLTEITPKLGSEKLCLEGGGTIPSQILRGGVLQGVVKCTEVQSPPISNLALPHWQSHAEGRSCSCWPACSIRNAQIGDLECSMLGTAKQEHSKKGG